ncbi:hypothetical protein [Thermus albus]|uniref:hypothetical protein n=1 Tax=Thermus albus TaxID=2908146 RepID=UPI001FA9FA0E|nr:hypothetical protein [Thermus albus]
MRKDELIRRKKDGLIRRKGDYLVPRKEEDVIDVPWRDVGDAVEDGRSGGSALWEFVKRAGIIAWAIVGFWIALAVVAKLLGY